MGIEHTRLAAPLTPVQSRVSGKQNMRRVQPTSKIRKVKRSQNKPQSSSDIENGTRKRTRRTRTTDVTANKTQNDRQTRPKRKKKVTDVEVILPGYSLHTLEPMRPCRSRTLIERVDDETFQRRHAKHVKHERTIVRRDRQRARELAVYERMMRRTAATKERSIDNDEQDTRRLSNIRTILIYSKLPSDAEKVDNLKIINDLN